MWKVYKEESDLACIIKQLKENPKLLNGLVAMLPELHCGHAPPIEVLAAYKDTMRISDHH